MPTQEVWLDDTILTTKWVHRLTADEVDASFAALRTMLDSAGHRVHLLFDLRESGMVPAQAPVLAIRSKFLESATLDKVVVVSTDVIAQILAKTASTVTMREILFFPLYDVAVCYLRELAGRSGQ